MNVLVWVAQPEPGTESCSCRRSEHRTACWGWAGRVDYEGAKPAGIVAGFVTGTRVDLHVKVLNASVVERAKARGIDVLVYAPHFTRLPQIRSAAERYSDDELLVVPAREVFTGSWRDRKHVLAVGLTEPVPDFITFDGAMREFARQNAAVLVPHPNFLSVSMSGHDVERVRDQIDAIEVYNPKHLPHHNRRARRLTDIHALPGFASSYAHFAGTVGEAWTHFEADLDTEAALVDALQSNVSRAVDHRKGVVHEARCILEKAHLVWENSWEKADRLFLSGMEHTHPRHIFYDGRFDEIAVY